MRHGQKIRAYQATPTIDDFVLASRIRQSGVSGPTVGADAAPWLDHVSQRTQQGQRTGVGNMTQPNSSQPGRTIALRSLCIHVQAV